MIEIHSLCKRFGDIHALSEVSFSVATGQIAGFLGANGAGKTTTLDILTGCLGADSGRAMIADYEISENPIYVKKAIGYLPDDPPLHPEMKVGSYLEYVANIRRVPSSMVAKKVDDCLEKLSLTEVKSRVIGNLSKGFRQRIGIAQAIIHDPKVLILDEPSEGLDPQQIRQTRQLIRGLKEHHTILFSSHILTEVENTCDLVIVIDKGKIVAQRSIAELANTASNTTQYSIKVREVHENIVGILETIPGVVQVGWEDRQTKTLTCHIQDQSPCIDKLALAIINNGLGLCGILPAKQSLEDIYFQLTGAKRSSH